jgi:hypothetical protein
MKNLKSIFFNPWGNPKHTTLENRVFNSVLFSIFLTGLFSTINNLVFSMPLIDVLITLLGAVVGLSFYIYSIKTGKYKKLIMPVSLLFLILISASWVVGYGMSGSAVYYFFVFTVAITIYLKGLYRRMFYVLIGVVIAALLMAEILLPDIFANPYTSRLQRLMDLSVSFSICLFIVGVMLRIVLDQLEKSVEEIKMLKQILPICSKCKKVRDDKGYWNQLEEYLSMYSDVSFTHSLCPDCAKECLDEYFESDAKDPMGNK